MEQEFVKETDATLQHILEEVNKLQDRSNTIVKNFFKKVFEENGQTSIHYEGEYPDEDNLIVEEGEIIAVREIFPETEERNGKQVYIIKVEGYCIDGDFPYYNELDNLESKNILGIFAMFKDQF